MSDTATVHHLCRRHSCSLRIGTDATTCERADCSQREVARNGTGAHPIPVVEPAPPAEETPRWLGRAWAALRPHLAKVAYAIAAALLVVVLAGWRWAVLRAAKPYVDEQVATERTARVEHDNACDKRHDATAHAVQVIHDDMLIQRDSMRWLVETNRRIGDRLNVVLPAPPQLGPQPDRIGPAPTRAP